MDLIDQLSALASRAQKNIGAIQTEEATKNALVLPFINALGYNVFDPTEVVPEFTCDASLTGLKKGEKVDYAIHLDGKPIMLFECKHVGADLNVQHASQLVRYFHVTEARIGVLTNGMTYRFYSDLEQPNKMDERPFFEFSLNEVTEAAVDELKKLSKGAFDLSQLLSAASELKYLRALKLYLGQQWTSPSEEFVKFLTKQVYDGAFTQAVREQFTGVVRKACTQFVSERVSDRLKSALQSEQPIEPREESVSPTLAAIMNAEDVVTTDEEMEGYRIIRAIVREVVPVSRVAMRDVKSYFGVLLDDNNRKPIARLYFNSGQKYLGLFDDNREESRIPISGLDDIYEYAAQLKATAGMYDSRQMGQASA